MRITHVSADPSGFPLTTQTDSRRQATSEMDLYAMFNAPLGSLLDHFYWALIYQGKGLSPTAQSYVDMPISLPQHNSASAQPVLLHLFVKGGTGYAQNVTHHLGIYINNVPFTVGDNSFSTQDPTQLDFSIPASFFSAGANTIRVQAIGDLVPDGDYDLIYVDRAEVDYPATFAAINGIADVTATLPDQAVKVTGFGPAAVITVYDITSPALTQVLDIPAPVVAGGASSITWNAVGGASFGTGRRYYAFDTAALAAPSSLLLGKGALLALKNPAQAADLIIVGPKALTDSAEALISARRAQGLRVTVAPLEQIFAEFSNGARSSQGIRDFVQYAFANWSAPAPRYLLFLGTATYDPRDRLGYGLAAAGRQPMPLERGLYSDFGSDNWFVAAGDGTALPLLAVGRIPADTAADLSTYLTKMLAYESGAKAPAGDQARSLVFVSDADHMNEKFAQNSAMLAQSITGSRSTFITSQIDRAVSGDSSTHAQLLNAFAQAPLALTYLGHGAEDRWADASVFTNTDAEALRNTTLPIVISLNCLSAYFYDADLGFRSLGEKMVMNATGGAIAVLASTTLTIPTAQLSLAQSFNTLLAQETSQAVHAVRIGDLALRSKIMLGASDSARDTLRSYTLLGDPSMPLPVAAFSPVSAVTASAPTTSTPSTPAATDSSDSNSHGFLSCGMIDTGKKGGPRGGAGGAPGAGATAEFALLLLMIYASQRLARRPIRVR